MGNKGRGKQKGEGGRERGLVTETAVLTTSSMSSIDIFSVIQYSVKRRSAFFLLLVDFGGILVFILMFRVASDGL